MDEEETTGTEESGEATGANGRRRRRTRIYPACPFEESVDFATKLFKFGSGQPVRRVSLFDHLQKSPDSSASRQLIVNANKYGLTEGSYSAENLKLTDAGRTAVDDEASPRAQTKERINLSIEKVEPFRQLYERFVGNRLPAKTALVDAVREFGVEDDSAEEAVDIFILNLRFVGLLQMLSGAERIVTVDHVLSELPSTRSSTPAGTGTSPPQVTKGISPGDFSDVCFYVTPIGEEGSEQRKHSDLFLSSIVEPALEQFKMSVIRADAIGKPGTITKQIIEYLVKAKLVIADLSFHNPNVFYELAIRHAARLPVVQIVRTADNIPFDLSQSRTVKIDTTDIYSLVPRLEVYKSEIATQVRAALADPDAVDNPISVFYPSFRATVD